MVDKDTEFDALRGEIDRIDGEMHDLLLRRAEVVDRIADAKKGTREMVMRPGREAEVMRRLLARHGGPLPRAVVACLWREIIAAMVRLQGPLRVAVCAPQRSVAYWDLARAHYGSSTPMSLHRSHKIVLRAVTGEEGAVGVLPLPQDSEPDPWWPVLAAEQASAPRVVARLPFVSLGAGHFEDLSALVVATCESEKTGADKSLLILAARTEISRARLNEQLRDSGFEGHCIAVDRSRGKASEYLHLVEIADFVAKKDSRTEALLARGEGAIDRVVRIGGYAEPYRS